MTVLGFSLPLEGEGSGCLQLSLTSWALTVLFRLLAAMQLQSRDQTQATKPADWSVWSHDRFCKVQATWKAQAQLIGRAMGYKLRVAGYSPAESTFFKFSSLIFQRVSHLFVRTYKVRSTAALVHQSFQPAISNVSAISACFHNFHHLSLH